METSYTKVFTNSTIIVKRLQNILNERNIHSRVKSDKLPGYEITNFIDELFVLNEDLNKVQPIIEQYEKEINL
ncbi:DUF2007 domain-containing protein [Polaribacter porphyrae]|uniref:DUF2007 domain-containing protein n=1 Tax=Polaribacter porphyrae TaxID=1137780 RepID=A0A2S7WTB0_9FLAO|nr:DUF2007 domain-containing protein [Polaribacter porphyrae]PQJ80804.1 hypothetical protein BTO18_17215 [Polaribacter porphyrae]